ncbi:MAG TPA: hypothetical protein VN702_14815 [Acetobacteraceae bacterium]|nr:hypothetical protein [Acetobacteraceae bacterium]
MLRSFLIVVGSVSGVALLGIALFGEPASTVHGVQQAVSGETETAAPIDPRQADDAAIRARIADLRLEVATLTKSVATLQDQAAQESSNLDALRQKRQAAQQSLERVETEQAHTTQFAADEAAQQAAAQKTQAEQEAARQEAARKAAAEQKAAQVAAAQKAQAEQEAARQEAARKAAAEQKVAQVAAAQKAAEERAAAEQAAAQKAAEQAAAQQAAAEAQAQQSAAQRQKAEEEVARRAAVEAAQAQQLAAQRQKAEQEAAQKIAADRAAAEKVAAEKAAQLAASRKATQLLEIEHAAAHQKPSTSPAADTQYASRNSPPSQVTAGSAAFPAGSAAIIARALPPPPSNGRPTGATQDNRDLGEAQTVLNRLRHQASASSRGPETATAVSADAPPDPASIEAQQRLQRIRVRLEQANGALSAGQYEDAQRLLQQVQLQLVFQPPGADQYDAGRTSRAAGDVARALGALGNRDPSGALRAIHQASESLGGSTPRMADADGRPMPFAFSPR